MTIDTTMQRNEVTRELLERLATLEAPGDARVLSLYLDLDPSENLATPAARRTAIASLLDQAERAVEGQRELSHAARKWLRSDLERVRELLVRQVLHDGLAEGAHGLAVFACDAADLLEAVRLPRPVASRVLLAPRPAIQPLAEIGPARRWAVVLSDGDDARLLVGAGDRLVEVESFHDEHRRRAGHGVWAPAHREAPLAHDELEHVRHVTDLVVDLARDRSYELIAVGAAEHIWGVIDRALPEDVRPRVIGRFDVDADEASPAEVRRRVEPLLRAADERRERAALDRLGERGVVGLGGTLTMLYERRVETLLLRPGLQHPGAACPRCGWVAERPAACPVDGVAMEPQINVVELAVERAFQQGADVLAVRHHDVLDKDGGMAAILRF